MPARPFPIDRRTLLRGSAAAMAIAPFAGARAATPAEPLELVATFTSPKQVTGVAVSPTGRTFVNFPRWEEDVAISVAEVAKDGTLTPYPDAAWNGFRNTSSAAPGQRFVCVQSVVVDPVGRLWVLDAAAPGLGNEIPGGPKIVRIDLATNQVSRVYPVDMSVAPQGAYLNDIRFTPDGRRAVITNSGQPGSLITLDIETGQLRNVLSGHPSTQAQQGMQVVIDGKPLKRPDGQPPQFSADGLAVDNQGNYAYWQPLTGNTMYRAPVASLFDASLSPADLGAKVETYARTFIADGYWFSKRGALYLTSCSDNSVKQIMPDRTTQVVVRDERLLWPDSMAEGADGTMYVTASHIPQMKAWQGEGVSRTALFRFRPPGGA